MCYPIIMPNPLGNGMEVLLINTGEKWKTLVLN